MRFFYKNGYIYQIIVHSNFTRYEARYFWQREIYLYRVKKICIRNLFCHILLFYCSLWFYSYDRDQYFCSFLYVKLRFILLKKR